MSAWIPVSERLPERFAEVLVHDGAFFALAELWPLNKWQNTETGSRQEGVTHWMPLPEPP
jgi:hypothetical protein